MNKMQSIVWTSQAENQMLYDKFVDEQNAIDCMNHSEAENISVYEN